MHLFNATKLFVLVLARVEGQAEEQLRGDAPEAPHVNVALVLVAHENLGRSVKSGLQIDAPNAKSVTSK